MDFLPIIWQKLKYKSLYIRLIVYHVKLMLFNFR